MSAVAEMKPAKSAEVLKNEVVVYGKVSFVRKHRTKDKDTLFFTLVRLPGGGDEFAQPSTVEIMSNDEIGKVNDVVTVRCALSGYARSYDSKPDGDGVIEKIRTADVKLRAI